MAKLKNYEIFYTICDSIGKKLIAAHTKKEAKEKLIKHLTSQEFIKKIITVYNVREDQRPVNKDTTEK